MANNTYLSPVQNLGMKIATYNVNGINGRLPVLLRWLNETQPDIVCLQELKAPQEKFPLQAIENAGYHAIWYGQKSWNGVAILSKDPTMKEIQRGLVGDDEDLQSRYLEVLVHDLLICCLYLPNGNPAPGPKFDYKLRWFERLQQHAQMLIDKKVPALLIGDFNVMPTELDVYKPERWVDDALFRPETRAAFHDWFHKAGQMRLEHFILNRKFILFGTTSEMLMAEMQDYALIIFCSVRQ